MGSPTPSAIRWGALSQVDGLWVQVEMRSPRASRSHCGLGRDARDVGEEEAAHVIRAPILRGEAVRRRASDRSVCQAKEADERIHWGETDGQVEGQTKSEGTVD